MLRPIGWVGGWVGGACGVTADTTFLHRYLSEGLTVISIDGLVSGATCVAIATKSVMIAIPIQLGLQAGES